MTDFKLIQVTPTELTELIRDGIRKELAMFKKDLKKQEDTATLLTIEETAKMLRVSKGTIKNLTKRGVLKSYGAGRRTYWKAKEIEEALTELERL